MTKHDKTHIQVKHNNKHKTKWQNTRQITIIIKTDKATNKKNTHKQNSK